MNFKEPKSKIFSGLIVAAIIAFLQWVIKLPILEYLSKGLNWLWTSFLNLDVKIWHLIALWIMIVILKRVSRPSPESIHQQSSPNFLGYKSDMFNGTEWRWDYKLNSTTNQYEIVELKPVCKNCQTPSPYNWRGGLYQSYMYECPRCDHQDSVKSGEKIQAIIIDNVNRKSKN